MGSNFSLKEAYRVFSPEPERVLNRDFSPNPTPSRPATAGTPSQSLHSRSVQVALLGLRLMAVSSMTTMPSPDRYPVVADEPMAWTPDVFRRKVESDGYTPVGEPVTLLEHDDSNGPLTQAPDIVKADGSHLFSHHICSTARTMIQSMRPVRWPLVRIRVSVDPWQVPGDPSKVGPLKRPWRRDISEEWHEARLPREPK
ncbi:hypothetical protein BDW62DRAFT_204478 [Aspergillus aurantiobrunneus]